MPEKKRKWMWLSKWIPISIGLVILLFIVWVLIVAIERPPLVADLSYLDTERLEYGENTYFVGKNWLRKSESGLWEMYIEGDPFERGAAFGKLTEELMLYQESAFFEMISELIPNPAYLRFLKYFTAWFNRNMGENIPDEFKIEIYGTSFSCSPIHDFIGTGYQRQLNYHAAHDIGHVLNGIGMVGCTSFSCWDDKCADSSLIIARNFDFFAGSKFAENKIVCFYNPSEGYKFMMVSWADMTGAVSGMNEKGVTVTINASKSTIPLQASTPVTLLAREILQYAENISQAYEIALERKLFVSESILIGSASDGYSAIIEKSPSKSDIFYSKTNQIICTNHFQGEAFRNDKINIENIRESDSQYRFERVTELLDDETQIDVNEAVLILRNRYGMESKDLGMGNQLSVNQLIAHHSIVFKPTQQLVWVSTEPYQLGKFVAYDLKKVFSLTKDQIISGAEIYNSELTIPADSFLFSSQYRAYPDFIRMTEELQEHSRNKKPLPDTFVESYIVTNPELYLTYTRLGNYYLEMEDYDQAYYYFQVALSKEIAGNDQRDDLITLSRKISNKMKHANTKN
jgi:hypothetical protein